MERVLAPSALTLLAAPTAHHAGHHHAGWGETALGFALFMVVFGGVIALGLRQQRRRPAAAPVEPVPPPPPAAAADGKRHAKMDRTNEAFIRELGAHDPAWRPEALKARVAEAYHKVQQAWTARNQDLAADCMTEGLYRRHKRQTDHMLALGKRNVLEDVKLLDVDLVYVADRQGQAHDEFWAVVRGEMIDYEEILDWERYAVACGAVDDDAIAALRERVAAEYRPTTVPTAFAELWKFERDPAKGWVLAKIDHDLAQVDDRPRPYSDDTYPHPEAPTAQEAR